MHPALFMETLQVQAAHAELFARAFLALVATVAVLYLTRLLLAPLKRRAAASSPSLPRPRGLPLIGNLHQLGAVPHDSLAALAAKHDAPLMLLRLGSVPTLVVSTADALRAAFAEYDEDGDGVITAVELRRALRRLGLCGEEMTAERCAEIVAVVDRNGDGVISFDEFKAMMATEPAA